MIACAAIGSLLAPCWQQHDRNVATPSAWRLSLPPSSHLDCDS